MNILNKQYVISKNRPEFSENDMKYITLQNGYWLGVHKSVPIATNSDNSAVLAGYAWDVKQKDASPYEMVKSLNEAVLKSGGGTDVLLV